MNIEYKNQKIKELNIINYGQKKENTTELEFNTYKEFLNLKSNIVKNLRAENLKEYFSPISAPLGEYNCDMEKIENNYTYDRFNNELKINNWEQNTYGDDNLDSIFITSGMIGICSIIYTLTLEDIEIVFHSKNIYFETIEVYSKINKSTKTGIKKCKVLYLDSMSNEFNIDRIEKEILLGEYAFIIFDTTCVFGKNLFNIIRKIKETTIPYILIRSLTKLDQLSTEYSHMGAITFSKNFTYKYLQILKSIKEYIKFNRGFLSCYEIPTFINSPDFYNYTNEKNTIIRQNNRYLYQYLKKNGVYAQIPKHSLFVILYIEASCELNYLKNKLNEYFRDKDIYYIVKVSTSFCQDYISIDCYDKGKNIFVLRISMSDFSKQSTIRFSKDLINFLISY